MSTLADQALVSLVNFSSFLLLARAMPDDELGRFAMAFTIVLMVTAIQQALLGSAYQVRGARLEGPAMHRFTTVVFTMQAAVATVAMVLLGGGAGVLYLLDKPEIGLLGLVLAVSVVPWMVQDLMRKVFYTRGRFREALYNDIVCYGLQAVGIVWLVIRPQDAEAWMGVAVYGGASFVAVVLGLFQLSDLIRLSLLQAKKRCLVVVREVWKFGRWLFGAQIWSQIGGSGHTWIIAVLMGPAALGSYRAAAHLVNVFNPIEIAISLWLPSRASREFAKHGAGGLQRWLKKIVPLLAAPIVVGVVGFAFLAESLLSVVYDGKFDGLGLHWIVTLLAFSRLIYFFRNIYQTGLVSGDRPDASLVDSLLSVVLKYGVGIPAVYFLQLYGAPLASLTVAVAVLVYNRRMFGTLGNREPVAPRSGAWNRVGAGLEGVVFKDDGPGIATKIYRDAGAVDGAYQYYTALCAAADNPVKGVKTPRPIAFEPEIPLIRMEACRGTLLRDFLVGPGYTPEKGRELARRTWRGLKGITDATGMPTIDLWFNMLYDKEQDELSFIDFGTPKDEFLFDRVPDRTLTVAGILGYALYDLSRPTQFAFLRSNARIRSFCHELWCEAMHGQESPQHLRAATEMVFQLAAFTGRWKRQVWYRTMGVKLFGMHSRQALRTGAEATAPGASPNVFHYIADYPEEGVQTANGVHRAVRGLAIGLTEAGAHTEILTEGKLRMSRTTPQGVDVHAFRRRFPRFPGFSLPAGLKEYIAALPDRALFVVHGQFSPRATRIALMLKRMGRPYVWMPHSLYSEAVFSKSPAAKAIYWHLFEKRVLSAAASIQVLDQDQADPLRDRSVATPAIVVPNAVDPDTTIPEDELEYNSKGPVQLYYLGRINFHQKGLDLLVRAVAAVREKVDVHLTIQGGGAPEHEELAAVIQESGVADLVTLLPADFETPSSRLMAAFDVFCMPSRVEGFPIAALDAMQAGRPLVFTDVSGLSETVQTAGCGVLVSPNVESVAEGLVAICAKRADFPEMGRAGQAYITSTFSRLAVGKTASEAYSRILSPARARHQGSAAPDRGPTHPTKPSRGPANSDKSTQEGH